MFKLFFKLGLIIMTVKFNEKYPFSGEVRSFEK